MFAGYKVYTVLEKKASCTLAKLARDKLFRDCSKTEIPSQILQNCKLLQ
jgi:hypothetical protein